MITAVIPVYKEPGILEFRTRLIRALGKLGEPWKIIWCVGDSLTLALFPSVCIRNEQFIYEKDRGLGRALTRGFQEILKENRLLTNDWILTMDSDLQQLPEQIFELWKWTALGYKIIIGAKGEMDARSFSKRAISKIFYDLLRWRTGLTVQDMGSNFRLYSFWAISNLPLDEAPTGFKFQQWALFHAQICNLLIHEVPTRFEPRTTGKSKMSFWREIKERFLR